LYSSNAALTPNSVAEILVGTGGTAAQETTTSCTPGNNSNCPGKNGANSTLLIGGVTITALGGGGGGGSTPQSVDTSINKQNGKTGGSSGGGNRFGVSVAATSSSFTGWTSYVNTGGRGAGNTAGNTAPVYGGGGGGGGAGSAGTATISPDSTTTPTPGLGGSAIFLIGMCLGGGGSTMARAYPSNTDVAGAQPGCSGTATPPNNSGGVGGGTVSTSSGTANTGGGGGAAGVLGGYGLGGSGIIIIKYLAPTPTPTSQLSSKTTTYSLVVRESTFWTVPTGVTQISAVVIGGGGGGGGDRDGIVSGGTGGAGGGYAASTIVVTPGESLLLEAGQGGAGAIGYTSIPSGSGASGSPSFIKRNSSFLINATGGGGGQWPDSSMTCVNPTGGTGTIGTTTLTGGGGGCGYFINAQLGARSESPGGGGATAQNYGVGGGGGANSGIGSYSTNYGAGGAAGTWQSASAPAGHLLALAGQNGAVLVTYKILDQLTTDLATASDSGSSSADNYTSDSTPTISIANFETGATATISATLAATTRTCTINSGSTNCDLPTLQQGTWSITATQTLSGANSIASAELLITIDTSTSQIVISSANSAAGSTPTIFGTAETGSAVTLVIAGATYATTATNGSWAVNVGVATPSSGTLSLVTSGVNALTVTSVDFAGNSSSANQNLTLSPNAQITLILVGGGNTVRYRTPVTLRATSSTAGAVIFYANGKRIGGCISLKTKANVADCSWRATVHGSITISARLTPSANGVPAVVSSPLTIGSSRRTTLR
jgi:hypothetical protein